MTSPFLTCTKYWRKVPWLWNSEANAVRETSHIGKCGDRGKNVDMHALHARNPDKTDFQEPTKPHAMTRINASAANSSGCLAAIQLLLLLGADDISLAMTAKRALGTPDQLRPVGGGNEVSSWAAGTRKETEEASHLTVKGKYFHSETGSVFREAMNSCSLKMGSNTEASRAPVKSTRPAARHSMFRIPGPPFTKEEAKDPLPTGSRLGREGGLGTGRKAGSLKPPPTQALWHSTITGIEASPTHNNFASAIGKEAKRSMESKHALDILSVEMLSRWREVRNLDKPLTGALEIIKGDGRLGPRPKGSDTAMVTRTNKERAKVI